VQGIQSSSPTPSVTPPAKGVQTGATSNVTGLKNKLASAGLFAGLFKGSSNPALPAAVTTDKADAKNDTPRKNSAKPAQRSSPSINVKYIAEKQAKLLATLEAVEKNLGRNTSAEQPSKPTEEVRDDSPTIDNSEMAPPPPAPPL
jgi:hypothetical protein